MALVLVAGRLAYVQVLQSGHYQAEASQELTQLVTVPALRGPVTDRNGVVLETSVPTEMVVADDFQVQHPQSEARALAPLLGTSARALVPLLSERSGYVPLVRNLPTQQAKKVAALAFPGITMIGDSMTEMPEGNLASPVVGAVNAAGTGAAGLEYEYNRLLAGHSGHETLLESPTGVQIPGTGVAEKMPAVAGTGLQLTLDVPLQYVAEQDLAKEMIASNALRGIAVVMDVHTGQILAMANLVSTSATAGNGTAPEHTTAPSGASGLVTIGPGGPVDEAPGNLAVTTLYEPGSVFKLVTFSAALADGVISPSTTFSVPDRRVVDGWVFHDAETHPVEQMSATQILAQSSNIGTSFVAQDLGEARLLSQVRRLGFGSPTPLGFPGSSPGLLVGPSQWNPTDFVSLAIGQTDAVSALQMVDAYNAIADGGVFVQPELVRATLRADGAPHPAAAPRRHRVVPARTAQELTTMLEQVVDAGTGVAASVPGYLVAGKTGTSQIPNGHGGYITGAFDGTFVGFAPANHPVLSAIVVLTRPQPIYGGSVAAPVFSQVMSYALHHYDVPTSPGLGNRPQAQVPTTSAKLVRAAA